MMMTTFQFITVQFRDPWFAILILGVTREIAVFFLVKSDQLSSREPEFAIMCHN